MTPKEFKGCNVTFAKDQPQYQPLPAQKSPDGTVLTEWEFSLEERIQVLNGANLRLNQLTFNQALQPILPFIEPGEPMSKTSKIHECTPEEYTLVNAANHGFIDARHIPKIIQISKLQHLSPEERLPYITTGTLPDILEFEKCECGHYAPLGFINYDEDSNGTCMNCVVEELQEKIASKFCKCSDPAPTRLPNGNLVCDFCLSMIKEDNNEKEN